ncbi:hypothetical protein PF005_g26678 [Phytophthora fragariae]|nr:hypothetical protein PF003_g19316 [Phytophthora fragariae]KAE8922372.1 hypothetical protein PF009_g27365 [Phytophthora fragariae]KAE8972946.1 hypothetical protein PF011_g25450 [Phytophthora fragariae]KAE9071837.1 hypothetical protein PF007_g26402 [Phytophthora fragariae]KAE9086471.1 hypothetical protein PF006_g26019 [Phytophthora fragariae]
MRTRTAPLTATYPNSVYVDGKKSGHDMVCFCFIKRFSAPLTKDHTLNHQLQVMTSISRSHRL